jgi:hypothetical protein
VVRNCRWVRYARDVHGVQNQYQMLFRWVRRRLKSLKEREGGHGGYDQAFRSRYV